MLKELQEHQVRFTGHIESSFGWREGLLSILLPLILFSMLFSYGARRIGDGAGQTLTFGKNRAKIYGHSSRNKVTFADVAGFLGGVNHQHCQRCAQSIDRRR